MKIAKLLCLAAVFLLSSVLTNAQSRKYSNEFLAIGVGARALGMSNSYVASVNDVTSGYWNPAGLLHIKGNLQVAAMHAELFAGIAKYDYGAFATPIDTNAAFGISMIRLGVDDIPNTINLIDPEGNINYDRITKFSAADYAFMASYARVIPKLKGLRLGANFKIIHRRAGTFARAWGFGMDVGAQYEHKGWKFGAMVRDITTTYNAWSFNLDQNMIDVFALTGNEIPENSTEITLPKILLGATRKFTIKDKFTVQPELDIDITTDGMRNVLIKDNNFSIDPHMGIELGYGDFIFLRGGIGNIQKIKSTIGGNDITIFQPNLGLGVRLKTFYIDWAMTNFVAVNVAPYSHIFSLKLDLYRKTK